MPDAFINELDQRFEETKRGRDQISSLLEECGKYIWPSMQDMVISVDMPEDGIVRTVDVYDSTAMKAATKMTSGVFSYLMPVGSKWFVFEAEDYVDNQIPEYKRWLSIATVETHKVIWGSNYLREMWLTVKSLIAFGNSGISYDLKKGFRMHPLQTVFFEENSAGVPDVVFKVYHYTKRQALQEFESVSDTVKSETSASKKHEFIHAVFPNDDYDGKTGSKRYASVYYDKAELKEVFRKGSSSRGGFNEQYYKIARMPKGPVGVHGEPVGKDLLPDIKVLNAAKEAFIMATEYSANPTTVLQDDGVAGQPVTGPGGLITMRPGAEKPYLLSPNSDLNAMAAFIAQMQEDIREGFFNNIFTPLEDKRNMTATEVDERVSEGLTLAAPLITPLNHEILDPMFLQVLNTIPASKLPPRPDGLKLKIVYQGRLALAMGKLQAAAGERWVAKWSPLTELYPVLDNVDIDGLARDSALNEGVPAERIVPEDVRDQKRAAQQQQQAIANTVGIAETASKAYKNVAGVPNA